MPNDPERKRLKDRIIYSVSKGVKQVRLAAFVDVLVDFETSYVRCRMHVMAACFSYGPVFIRNNLFIDISRVGLGAGNEHDDSVQACGPFATRR